MALLDVRGLVKWYGLRKVVDGVSFEVNAGEVVGLLGPNGAGKTTSFRMTTGQITPNEGAVWFDGKDVTRLPMYQRARLGMGYLSQEPSIFRKLSVEKNLIAILEALPRSRSLGRRLTRRERWERTDAALTRFSLTHVRKNLAARCSGGEKRRLEIARCLVCEPLLILLDEPFAAVDPLTTEDIRHNIRELARAGIGILLTDHNVREVLKITDRSYLIKDGKVVVHGTPEQIKRDPVAIREYLGNTFADDPLVPVTAIRQPVAMSLPEPKPIPEPTSVVAATAPVKIEVIAEADNDVLPPIDLREHDTSPAVSSPVNEHSTPTRATPAAVPPSAVIAAATVIAPPPAGQFSSTAQSLLEREKMRRQVELFADDVRWQVAWHDLSQRGLEAVPVLLEALEWREVKIRHLAFRLLEQITGESLTYSSDAPDDVRLKQVAHLRARLERRKAS
jgi:lipopolysaccharide export system ATP-binding protein